jgi:outer membrane protein assembly factor BamB
MVAFLKKRSKETLQKRLTMKGLGSLLMSYVRRCVLSAKRRRSALVAIGVLMAVSSRSVQCEDWPTFRHDQQRSGRTLESLEAARLAEVWRWQSGLPPAPAWPDSARWDAYATLDGLRSMRDYDPVFHPVVAGQRVFVPSNADDTIRCLDIRSGQLLWQFTVNAPIRISPTVFEDCVYFGSDDGSVVALNAESGKMLWTQSAAVSDQSFLNDGRICSFEPVRTGVLIDADSSLAIVAAGMFPWRESFLVALSLDDGSVRWRRELGKGWSLEGAMLLASQHIVAPQGRVAPQLFHRQDGQPIGSLEGGGGTFVLLTEEDEVLHGPGNKAGWITQSNVGSRERVATFERARAIVLNQQHLFLLDETRLHSLDRQTNNVQWSIDCDCPHDLILAGDTLFAGGNDRVRGFDASTGRLVWHAPVSGRAMGLVVANGHLLVSTDEGAICAFAPSATIQQHDTSAQLPDFAGAYAYPALAPPPVADADESLLDRWVFHANQVIGVGPEKKRLVVQSLVTGASKDREGSNKSGNHAPLSERFKFVSAGQEQALLLDGRTHSAITSDGLRVARPSEQMTVAAWVRVDRPQPLGAIAAMTQEDGQSASGWILGFRDDQFALGLRTSTGPGPLTWVQSEKSKFEPGAWYFVVGTFDGQAARLYINQQLAASSNIEGKAIQYLDRVPYYLGAQKSKERTVHTEGMLNEVRVYNRAISEVEIKTLYLEKAQRFPGPASVSDLNLRSQLAGASRNPIWRGPMIQFTAPQTATVRWMTAQPQRSVIELLPHSVSKAAVQVQGSAQSVVEHVAVISPIRHHEVVKFRLGAQANGELLMSDYFECDGHFDFHRPSLPELLVGDADSAQGSLNDGSVATPAFSGGLMSTEHVTESARRLLDLIQPEEPRGWGIVLGAGDQARLAEAVCRASGADIVALDADPERVLAARRRLVQVGLYGRPVSVHTWKDSPPMLLPNRVADFLIIPPAAEQALSSDASQVSAQSVSQALQRMLFKVQPGGRAVIPTVLVSDDLLIAPDSGLRYQRQDNPQSGMTVLTVPQRTGAADWTHTYGQPDNSAFAGETLSGASSQADLTLVWAGRPGPRYQSDRGNRKPSPLSSSGRLYMQGLKRVIGVDAFNGTILWAQELPEAVRFNIPRDCSNWCADDQYIYLAARDRCLVMDSATGKIERQWNVLNSTGRDMNWGFVARQGNLLIGSSTAAGAAFTEFWGGEFWYDEKVGEHSKKVCSDSLFATDVQTGEIVWSYEGGLVVNPTITIADGLVYMLVCKSKKLKLDESRRLEGEEFWSEMHLVALDAQTGITQWDVPAKPMEGKTAVYLAAASGKLVLVTSMDGAFGVYGLDAKSGDNLWRGKFNWQVDHHGKHLSRPAIVDGKIYLRPLTLDLDTGKVLSESFPEGHQCGTYSASRYALFLRAGELAVWDRNTGESTRWDRVRPDCWISTIPAQGMLLSPEGGGGCSCGGWIETSMAFAPTVEQTMKPGQLDRKE